MISRVADHCLWFGRYLERAESTARVLHVTASVALDAELTEAQCWRPVLIVSGEEARFTAKHGAAAEGDGELVQRHMTWDEDNFTSIIRSVSAARDNARSIREVVSLEAWETVNELYLWISSAEALEDYEKHRYGFYRRIRSSVQLCLGLLRSTMLHDTPLDFMWLGVMLERAGQTARILDVHHHALTSLPSRHQVIETALWLSLLRACSGFEPFMKRHQGKVSAEAVAAFLLIEPAFPRSIRYCVHTAYQRYCDIRPPEASSLPGRRAHERLAALDDWICQATPEGIGAIHAALTHVVSETALVCDDIARELFGQGEAAPVATVASSQ